MVREDLQKAWDESGKINGISRRKPPGLEDIESSLNSQEQVLVVLKGWKGSTQPCTIVLTDQQIYLFSYFGLKQMFNNEAIQFAPITGVELKQTAINGLEVRISRSGNTDRITQVDRSTAEKFTKLLQELISTNQKMSSGHIQTSNPDPIEQLQKLKQLLEAGILSEAEYEEKRKLLLDRI